MIGNERKLSLKCIISPRKRYIFPNYWLTTWNTKQPLYFLPCVGLALTLSRPCFFGNVLLGVVGVAVALADALEPISYFPAAFNSYAFLIDTKGKF